MRVRLLAPLLLAGSVALAQAPVAFEVASVRPNVSGSGSSGTQRLPNGQFIATNVAVRSLIVAAYQVPTSR